MRDRRSISRVKRTGALNEVSHWFTEVGLWAKRHKVWASIICAAIALLIVAIIFWFIYKPAGNEVKLSPVATEYQKQLPALKDKVSETPDDASARKNYAIALYATGKTDEAVKQYEEAVKINDKDATAYNNLGNAYRDLKKTDKAVEAYKKALTLNPKSLNTYSNLANLQLYTKNKSEDAIETYKQGLVELPENSQLELLLGIAYEHSNNKNSAKETYQHILTYDPDNKAANSALNRIAE